MGFESEGVAMNDPKIIYVGPECVFCGTNSGGCEDCAGFEEPFEIFDEDEELTKSEGEK